MYGAFAPYAELVSQFLPNSLPRIWADYAVSRLLFWWYLVSATGRWSPILGRHPEMLNADYADTRGFIGSEGGVKWRKQTLIEELLVVPCS